MRPDLDSISEIADIAPRGIRREEAKPQYTIPSHKVARRILTLLFCGLLIAGCAGAQKVPPKRFPPRGENPPAQKPLPPGEKPMLPPSPRSNVTPSTQDVVTPKRQASMRLVDKGKVLLDGEDVDRAAAAFMDAVGVDGSNGIAYYYLAEANQRLGKNEIALGLLDKAEAMLGADQGWMEKIDELRAAMGETVIRPTGPSPIDQQF